MLPDGYTDLPPGKLASVVTYLEMRCRPRLERAIGRWDLRRITQPDPAVYRALFREIGAPWLWFSRLALEDAALAALLGHPEVDLFYLYDGATPRGLLELDRRHFPGIEIAFIGVTEELTGKGAGRFLMNLALEQAWAHNPERVWLHTCTLDHPRALPFYLRSGFVPYKRALEIAADPRLQGLLPRDAAPGIPIL